MALPAQDNRRRSRPVSLLSVSLFSIQIRLGGFGGVKAGGEQRKRVVRGSSGKGWGGAREFPGGVQERGEERRGEEIRGDKDKWRAGGRIHSERGGKRSRRMSGKIKGDGS